MTNQQKPRGPWINRFISRVLTLVLGVLIFWLLGFLVKDIKQTRGPDYTTIEKDFVDADLEGRQQALKKEAQTIERQIKRLQDEQNLTSKSSSNLQGTIKQLLELKKMSIEKDIKLPEVEENNLSNSLSTFLSNQEAFQELNKQIAEQGTKKRAVDDEMLEVSNTLESQRRPANEEYDRQRQKHRLRLAAYQLAILVPLLLVGGFLVVKRRGSIYFPLYFAFAGATLIKVALVIHEYFPAQYFKYILIGILLLVVARVLIHFIRLAAFPKQDWLLRQYREAYERFLCPVCEYPIRTGPRRFLYWTRRTVTKRGLDSGGSSGAEKEDQPYTCPSCGTGLFVECSNCDKTRHALLPHCQHCGDTTPPLSDQN